MPTLSIPPVPSGIENPNDLYNGDYNELPDLRWDNPDFHAKLAWIVDNLKKLLGREITIAGWAAARNIGPGDTRLTSTYAAFTIPDGRRFDADCRNIMLTPMSVVAAIYEMATMKWMPQITPYPGLDALYPDSRPVGTPWPDHPITKSNPARKFFYLAPGDKSADGTMFEDETARYVKIAFLVPGSAQGPFGTGAKIDRAWEQVYTR